MSSLSTTLLRSARSIAGQLTSLAKSKAPKHLQAGISTHVTEETEGVIRITLETKGTDARAQEYGSGLQDRKSPHKYPITPKPGHKYLAFQWDVAEAHPEVAKFLPDGRFFITKVMHPGIHAVNEEQGYVRPALKEFRKYLKEGNFPDEIRSAIVSDIRRSFRGNNA